MREILFKGFHECENGETVITVNGVEKHGKWVEGDLYHDMNEEDRPLVAPINGYGKDVISLTVSQFTGLTDKNGKRIFENDIVSDGVVNYVIEFYNSAWFKRFMRTQDSHSRLHYNANYLEVNGNIFENADLMEEEK